ncbi:MAG: SAM-dependent chlorinase/fluorinase [Candidatus Omnitrophota bacterium]|jgi:S-adenosylmethionine hydrolase
MIITLLTDFGLGDNFAGVIKGVILRINPKVEIIDISHNINPGDIFQAAFLLKSSYHYFPPGTIHLVVVDPGVGSKRKAIIAKSKNYYFIGPDNGVLSLALEAEEKVINQVCINNQRFFLRPVSSTFHGRDIFAPVAAYLSRGMNIAGFGTPQKGYQRLMFPSVRIKGNTLQGEIIYIDRFGNLISNIKQADFIRFVGRRNFRISLKHKLFDQLSRSYLAVKKNKPLAIFGSFGNLEISVSLGNARDYFKARKGQPVKVILN